MKISEQELIQEAAKTGFRPEILEKVWHLMSILDGISIHPFLIDKLALKGGTALNLFLLEVLPVNDRHSMPWKTFAWSPEHKNRFELL